MSGGVDVIDHRRLQRALFRLQIDDALAREYFAGQGAAREALGLGPEERALLDAVDYAGVSADRGGRRRTQVLGNASSEFSLSLCLAGEMDQGFLQAFAQAPEFHCAIAGDQPLPFAFAAYGRRWARERRAELLEALIDLEEALARVRRVHRTPPAARIAPQQDLSLPPGAHLLELSAEAWKSAEEIRMALDAGRRPTPQPQDLASDRKEWVLLVPRADASPYALAEVHVECLAPPADELLQSIEGATETDPFGPADRARFAREFGAQPADLEAFVEELVRAGLLLRHATGD